MEYTCWGKNKENQINMLDGNVGREILVLKKDYKTVEKEPQKVLQFSVLHFGRQP